MKTRCAALALFAAIALLFLPPEAGARPAYAGKEKKACTFCHVGTPADGKFTEAGAFYGKNKTLEGFSAAAAEKAPAPAGKPPGVSAETKAPAGTPPPGTGPAGQPKAAGTAAPAPAKSVEAKGPRPDGDKGRPCPEGCEECAKKGHGHGSGPMMMGGMKEHLEEARKAMSALREHEKAMEGVTEAAAFRGEVLKHLRMVDDYAEMHLKRMESMAGRMEGMRKGGGSGECGCPPGCNCPHCKEGKECPCPCGK